MKDRSPLALLLRWQGAFAIALLVRLCYLATAHGTSFAHPLIDADYYDMLGQRLSEGAGFPEGPFWQPPLYPLLLGALYEIAGHTLWAPRIVQALLGASVAAMAYEITRRITEARWVAFAAGLFVALHGPLVFYDGELLATSLGIFLGALALFLATLPRPSFAKAIGAGAAVGLGALAVAPQMLLVAPVAYAAGAGRRARGLACAAACAAMILPAALFNHARTGEWIAISANGGVNLWIGNGPNIDRSMAIRPGAGWEELIDEPVKKGISAPGAQDSYFVHKTSDFCASKPLACLRNVVFKARLLLAARELPRNEDLYVVRKDAPVLAALTARVGSFALPHALLLPLAAAGAVVAFRARRREAWGLLGAAFAVALGMLVFFVTGRYRAPLAPFACALAALGLFELWQKRRDLFIAARAPVIAAGATLMLALLPVQLAVDSIDFDAEMHYAAGGRLARLGDDQGAVNEWSQALARRPAYREAAYNKGLALERLGRPSEAVAAYEALLAKHPDALDASLRRAFALLAANDAAAAGKAFVALLDRDPQNGVALLGLARVAMALGNADEAEALLARASPALGDADEDLARAREQLEAMKSAR